MELFEIPITYWLDSLPAYSNHEGMARLLDNTRQVYLENYYPLIIPFPESDNVIIPGGKLYQGAIRPPRGSILVSMSGQSSNTPGFMFRLYDTATKGDLFVTRFGKDIANICSMDPNNYHPTFIGPTFLQSPLIVLDDNGWQITVQNMDIVNAATIQIAFAFAVPFVAGKKIDMLIEGVK